MIKENAAKLGGEAGKHAALLGWKDKNAPEARAIC